MHMSHRLQRLAARFFAVSLLAATLFTVDSLASPSPAEARCKGVNTPVYSWYSPGEGVAGSETPGTGTCNGNNIYSGVLKDEKADGYCVLVHFREAGRQWGEGFPVGGNVCGNNNTSSFQYEDVNGNSYVYQQFCIYRASDLVITECGWGNESATPSPTGGPYAVNSGF
jgi:hypothetical protein